MVAAAEPPKQLPPEDSDNSKVIAAGVATGAFAISTALSFAKDRSLASDAQQGQTYADYHDQERWRKIMIGCATATVVSAAVTAYFWTRTQPRYAPVVNVSPENVSLAVRARF